MLLVVEEQDSTCSLASALTVFLKHVTCYTHTNEILKYRHSYFPVCPQSTRCTGYLGLLKQLTEKKSIQNHCKNKQKVENKNIGYCTKFSALQSKSRFP